MNEALSHPRSCVSCWGTGERVTEFGPTDCPDCGGAGVLPPRSVLVEWRARDVERAHADRDPQSAGDVRWLVTELRRARDALTEIIALAHDVDDEDGIARRIRFTANRALGTYEIVTAPEERSAPPKPKFPG
jgi:hypothetical protein